jgi:maltose-binding protein MalE
MSYADHREVRARVDLLPLVNFGANLAGVGGVLWLLASGKLVARSWAIDLVSQANRAADRAEKAAEAADTRADLLQASIVEQTAALRAVETFVRLQSMPGGGQVSWPGPETR